MLTVFIVDDSATARRALRLALEKSPQLAVVGEADTPDAAMRLIPRLNPQLVTMDVHLELWPCRAPRHCRAQSWGMYAL